MPEGTSEASTVRDGEMRYRALFDGMMDGIASCRMIFDEENRPVDWIYLDVNDAFEELTGLRGVVGQKVSEVIPGLREANLELLEIYGRVASSGRPEAFDSYVAPLRTWFHVAAFCPKQGQFVATFQNITERKKAERALQESRGTLLAALDSMTDAVFISDVAGNFVDCNDAFATFHRFKDKSECLKRLDQYPAVLDVFMANGEPAPLDMWAVPRALRGEALTSVEYTLRRKDTGATWVGSYSFGPIRDSQGEIVGSVVVSRDVTERKRMEAELHQAYAQLEARVAERTAELSQANALLRKEVARHRRTEAALAESEMRFRFVLENAVDVAYRRNLRTDRNEYMSPAGEKLFGYTTAEMLEMPTAALLDHIHPDDRPVVKQAITESMSARDLPRRVEYRFRRKSGEYRWVSDGFTVVWDDQGQPVHLVGTVRDIDDQKGMEERLHRSEKLASVGQLAGGIAHNFNNQLASILGYADLLRERLQDETLLRYATNILTSSRRAADLTAQLLAFARKGKYLAAPVDMHRLVGDTVLLLQQTIDRRIEVRKHLAADHATVVGDPTQLQNALLNLGLNARDAMPAGGIFAFETTAVDLAEARANELGVTPGPYLQLSVTDSGTGMSLETQGHLFEPFFTTKGVGQGTGLGLAAVHGTVKSHHGAITVDSEIGRGTTFIIHLPLHAEARCMAVEAAAMPARDRAHVLLVDDEDSILEVGTDMLRSLGYEVTTCRDGEEAVARYREDWQHIDLVLLDVIMPRLNGRDTLAAMRQVCPHVRALILSGGSLEGGARALLDEGALGLIQKPFRLAELSRKVADALHDQGPPGEPRSLSGA